MEFGTTVSSEEARATNISRSGRVRKKSSKLLDYETTGGEIERRKGSSRKGTLKKGVKIKSKPEFVDNTVQDHIQDENKPGSDEEFDGHPPENDDKVVPDISGENGSGSNVVPDENEDLNDVIGVKPKLRMTKLNPQDSVYVKENAKKKRGKKTVKTTEKKTRFSAYMLWAREVRKEVMKSNPDIDISQLNIRMRVLWASVPYLEKYSWQKKAKRLARSAKTRNRQQIHSKTTLGTYINKRRPKKTIEKVKSPTKPKQKLVTQSASTASLAKPEASTSTSSSKPIESTTQSMDVAAHLKLLGESLEGIGERLQQHDGGNAVTGSLSVLLDSLLCSAGPLLCLTKYVDQLNGGPPEKLDKIIDNVSYIMPGL